MCLFKVEAVRLIQTGKAPRIKQPEEGATYECIQKKDNAKVGVVHYFDCWFCFCDLLEPVLMKQSQ